MASADRLRDLLPSLWRPEPDAPADDLLAGLLRAGGRVIDTASTEAGDVMQSHWFRFADSALLSPYVSRFRAKAGQSPLLPADPDVDLHPYLDDLARLAGLLGLVPWTQPLDARETVEDFRRRVARMATLWKDGLGTRAALRAITQAMLPVMDRAAAPGLRERGFTVEERAGIHTVTQVAATRGIPDARVGPLMRWRIDSGAVAPTAPEIYIEGQAEVPGQIDPTARPVIERFNPALGTGIGIAYQGTVAPGQTLALLPTFSSWLGVPTGLLTARAEPGTAPADPTAPGPWAAAPGGPAIAVRALAVAADGALWAGGDAAGVGALWRLGAGGWTEMLSGLPRVFCLLTVGTSLLVGHANGLSRTPMIGVPPALVPPAGSPSGPAVRALAADRTGRLWAATARGPAAVGTGDTLHPVGPGERVATRTAMNAVHADADGQVYFGGVAGLFLHDPTHATWHVYQGGTADETVADWARWDPASDALPADGDVFLPNVTALMRGSDQTLWIGTAAGIAAYRARARLGTYATLLTAFPELGTVAVTALAEDERQRVWAGTARGLVVFDGLDWRQARAGALVRLPRAPFDPLAFTHWRFHRPTGFWQAQESGARGGFTRRTPAVLTTPQPAIQAIAWTDGAIARLGTFADGVFTHDTAATPAALVTRIKPNATSVIDGGPPAIPRLGVGVSDWRYLAREENAVPAPSGFPAWTREGRLLPPPSIAAAAFEGRFLTEAEAALLDAVFAYNPAARVTFRFRPRAALAVIVRLERRAPDETISDAVLDRLWDGIGQVRPAGARVVLAVGADAVRGGQDG